MLILKSEGSHVKVQVVEDNENDGNSETFSYKKGNKNRQQKKVIILRLFEIHNYFHIPILKI